MKRISIIAVLALVTAVLGVVGSVGRASATSGASKTSVVLDPNPTAYGESVNLAAIVQDVSGTCSHSDCDTPKGRVDWWYAPSNVDFDSAKQFIGSDALTLGVSQGQAVTDGRDFCCLPPGSWRIRGYYVADIGSSSGNFDPSSGEDIEGGNK